MSMISKQSLVLFPSSGMGHLIPMLELAKLLVTHNFSITILIVNTPNITPISTSFLSRVSLANPSISFHTLPPPTLDDLLLSSPFAGLYLIRASNHLILDYLRRQRPSSDDNNVAAALILDMFCTSAIDVAEQLGIPSYIFYSSNASALSTFVLTPAVLDSMSAESLAELGDDTPLDCFPGLPPIAASDIPAFMHNRGSELYKLFVYDFSRIPMADGIIANTVAELERRAVASMNDGTCYPGRPMPPVYCVGPLIIAGGGGGGDHRVEETQQRHECLSWLDEQPRGSVVFLSFGSVGRFSREQLKEISAGLENSGQRFLWVVRNPPPSHEKGGNYSADVDLDGILPEGFLERTMGRGMVVKAWAPQAEVLRHESVGGFVTHCGWNSILEAVSCGVAMIAWPMYAEQRLNKVVLVEEMRVAVVMEGYDKEMVSGEEVEKKVRWLMESEGGRDLKQRAAAMKEKVVEAWEEGGSSERNWREFVKALSM